MIMKSLLQTIVVPSLRTANAPVRMIPVPTSGSDKKKKASAIAALAQDRGILLPTGAAWLAHFLGEVLNFPLGSNDDQVDALALIGRVWYTQLRPRASVKRPNAQPEEKPFLRLLSNGEFVTNYGLDELFQNCTVRTHDPERICSRGACTAARFVEGSRLSWPHRPESTGLACPVKRLARRAKRRRA